LTDKLKDSFPKTKPATRAEIQFAGIPNPNWLAGFVDVMGLLLSVLLENL
jgi:hypothetical protein